MIRQLYQYSWSSDENGSESESETSSCTSELCPIENNTKYLHDTEDNSYNIYMIHDLKTNAFKNDNIKIHMSLMNGSGQKKYLLINNDIKFDVFIEAKHKNEIIENFLPAMCYFDNTPQLLHDKFNAIGYKSTSTAVWRLNIDRNVIDELYEFCVLTQRQLFLNTELNDALLLVHKSLGVNVKIKHEPDFGNDQYESKYISYNKITKPNKNDTIPSYVCRKMSIDIEVVTPTYWKLFPDANEKGCEIIIIACTLQKNDEPYETIVLYLDKLDREITFSGEDVNDVKREFIKFNSEDQMLLYFIGMINPFEIDLITGWNVRNFDLKYIYDRCRKFYPQLVPKFRSWTLNGSNVVFRNTTRKGQNITLVDCFGIIILDMYDYNKINVKAKSYKLKDIAKQFLQDDKQKKEMNYKDISKFYTNGTNEQFSSLLEYCSVDAEIVLDLMMVQKVWNNTVSMADICHVPINYVINQGVMLRNVCMISEFINHNTNYMLPYKHKHDEGNFEGGFVNDPIVGFHTNPIFVLDFNSLYPTTMLAFNICTTTIVHNVPQEDNYNPQNLQDVICHMNNAKISMTPYMKNIGFVSSETRKGVLPQILDNLLKTRKSIQNELKNTTCSQKYKQLDAQQLSYKLCANAIYGILGCRFSPLYYPEVAASVTGFGRFLSFIKRILIIKYMQEDNITGRIIYGDTDSVMVEVENKSIAEAMDIAQNYAVKITKDIGIFPIKTEYEKIFCPFLIHKKKHYSGVMYTSNPDEYHKIEYKGNEMVRSDNCLLTTKILSSATNVLFFHGTTIEHKILEIGKVLRKILQDWSQLYHWYITDNSRISEEYIQIIDKVICDGIYSKKLSKEVYKNKLPHVAVYERMKNKKQYNVGDRIIYCIANTEFTDKIKPKNILEMAYDIDEFKNSKGSLYLSIHYYLDACVRKPLNRLFETLDAGFKRTIEQTIIELFPPLENKTECSPKKKRKKL